jgi:CheY-like chemotaxis protein
MASSLKPTVLVVEDELLVRIIIAEELQEAGFEVLEAGDGHSAIDMLKRYRDIDLLFTDIRMPGELSGWDVAEQARKERPDLPVIYATGFSEDPLRVVEGARFFKKPYRPSSILEAARELGVIERD